MRTIGWEELIRYQRPKFVNGRYLQVVGVAAENFSFDQPIPPGVDGLVRTVSESFAQEFGEPFKVEGVETPKTPDPGDRKKGYMVFVNLQGGMRRKEVFGCLVLVCTRMKSDSPSSFFRANSSLILPLDVPPAGKVIERSKKVVTAAWDYIEYLHESPRGPWGYIHDVFNGILNSGHRVLEELGLKLPEKPFYKCA